MKKIATIAAAALLAGVGTYALAQAPAPSTQPPAATQERGGQETRRGLTQDDFNRLVDARVASIRAGLKLSAEQERLWPPVEEAIRAAAAERFERFEQRRAMRESRQTMDLDFMQRLERHSTRMTENAQRASAVAAALRPLWDTLGEDQKRIAPRLLRPAVAGRGMGWRERGGHRGHHGRRQDRMGGMMQRGPGMMGGGDQQAPAQPSPQQQ